MLVVEAFKKFNIMRAVGNYNILSLRKCHSGHIVQMRGLDYDTTEDDIIDFFKPLGIVPAKIHLKSDGSGRTAGFSEVEFNTHSEAVIALRKKNAFIGNRFIRLTLKSTDGESMKLSDNENTATSYFVSEKTQSPSKDKTEGKILESLHSSGYFVRMENMPWRITDQDIFDFFLSCGCTPSICKAIIQ